MKFFLIFISIIYINLFSSYCLANEDEDILKIGLIAPLSGKYHKVGKSVLNSIRLALSSLNDEKIKIFPKDNGSSPEKTLLVAKELEKEGIQIIIGPIFHKNLFYLDEVENLIFLSLTNKSKDIPKNVVSIGVNANSQIDAIINFLKKENLKKTIVLVPISDYGKELKNVLSKKKYKFKNIYSYDVEPNKLTSQIEQITAYGERKRNLERRIKILEKSDNPKNKKKLESLKKKYTLGDVNFDSVIIADFGENLKGITTSFSFSDVTGDTVKFITLNQWFDETLFKENSMNQIYFPSINLNKYSKFRKNYLKNYHKYPAQIAILSYDILGLIYYITKNQKNNFTKEILNSKKSYIGEVGTFFFKDNQITHKLNMYQVLNNKFVKIN